MSFKIFYLFLWMLLISFTIVKGSCLEYGHSCWGAHGKRSGNNQKIFRTDAKPHIEIAFQDLTDLREKNPTGDSNEEQMIDSESSGNNLMKDSDEFLPTPEKNAFKLKRFLLRGRNKSNNKQWSLELPRNQVIKASGIERWRRLPLHNLRNVQVKRPDHKWLQELEQEQQLNVNDYI